MTTLMNDRIGEIAQNVHDIKRPWSNVTMRKTNVDDKDEGYLAESKEEENCLRLDEVETAAKIHEEGIKATQDKVDRLNDQVEYLTGLTESMGTRAPSTSLRRFLPFSRRITFWMVRMKPVLSSYLQGFM